MDPLTKLYRIRKTVHEMLKARNYVVSARELSRTKDEARRNARALQRPPHRAAHRSRGGPGGSSPPRRARAPPRAWQPEAKPTRSDAPPLHCACPLLSSRRTLERRPSART